MLIRLKSLFLDHNHISSLTNVKFRYRFLVATVAGLTGRLRAASLIQRARSGGPLIGAQRAPRPEGHAGGTGAPPQPEDAQCVARPVVAAQ